MTTPHDKAVLAADEAYQNVQSSEGIEHLTSEQQHMRGVAAAISAYLASIGGIVCVREPSAWKWSFDGGTAWHFGPNKPGDFRFGNPDLVVPLHAPIPEAENGDGWIPAPRGGVEPNWWEEWVKTTRAYNALAKAAQAVIDETDKIHDSDDAPIRYRAPYGAITKLREALASSDRASLVSPPSIRSSDTGRGE